MLVAGAASAAPFSPGNILVTQNNRLIEFTLEGVRVQSMQVPHPDTTRHDATDVVVDRFGRAHVLNIAPFAQSYLSSYDPVLETWTHLPMNAFLGNVSDGDASILGDFVFTKRQRIDVITQEVIDVIIPGRSVGEISVGLDGLIYALDSGSPRPGLRVLDPVTLSVIRELTLRDSQGFRLNARGVAVNVDGTIYIADWDGRIYVYDAAGALLGTFPSFAGNLLDIDLSPGGVLIVGSRFGAVTVTDITFENTMVFSAGSGLTYVGFVPTPPNFPPDCTTAQADLDELWPPDHKFEDVSVVGVTDPDGDPVSITITAIAQDEPPLGQGDGNTCPDGDRVGTDIASVRAERSGPGDGRVYHISFTADDGLGGECSGAVTMCVPHDQGEKGSTCVDGGPIFDSMVCDGDWAAAASAAGFGRNCGIGFELTFLLPALMWAYGRRRCRRRLIH